MKTAKLKPKDRILKVSAELFYAHDANTIGVDTICESANVSKRTLYKHYPTKEILISMALQKQAEWWSREFDKIEAGDPLQRINEVFRILERNAGAKDFHGCPMMNTSVECRDSNALAKSVAKDFKSNLFEYFRQHAEALNAKNSDALAQQLVLLYDGCNAWIVMRRKFPESVFAAIDALVATNTRLSDISDID